MGAIYLVRHGQASFGSHDYDALSERGLRQAAVVGDELRRRGPRVTHVFSGTMRRQRDTAEAAGFDARQDARWNEYAHQEVLAAHTALDGSELADPRTFQAALDSALGQWVRAGSAVDGAEGWPEFACRVHAAFDEVLGSLGKGEDAVVFTSGGVIGALVARVLGQQAETFIGLHRVTCNGGITKLVTGRSGTNLVSFNEHGHLENDSSDLLTYR
ncbi:Broad specificity phosphatase PhoE [Haloechinothrix alba]|uniref:Broad specificity phosphatase PhoE n=1 Tax=Haloechinothrix alba TaxID=664784 RepID=A0A238WR26_9PSEU|nr:histidine phosphatase family protein [Haloechinothrix alba]SNR48917.1 Broad specificity phosphatase PhoE [Haloechinothrix alba]